MPSHCQVLEKLYTQKWSRMDGTGAIIISPTRELAYQIFETLRKVGAKHDFSAGLIIGGKNLKFERGRMDQCNIMICTPGRLLQHMDENPLFNATSMQILVLDEADRCLDMGFEQTMNAIIENLPPERQTLLFSATQTKSVKDLARLSLDNPVYVAPHEQQMTTPQSLQQNYVVINLEDKITMLWSFIKNHLKQKCIVFMSSCKQVKYIYEIFCKLRPGTSLLALYGTLHQDRRVAIYNEFMRKSNVVLFATDVASRGLDFPVVNWVIQLDCPEDVTQYIHRAGRTARHKAKGESLLVLLPNEEEAMIEELTQKKISINKISIDPRKMFSPRAKMEAFLAQSKELKESAQRAFVSYIKSVILMKNKKVFNVEALDTDAYARSLGLVVVPRIRFLQRLKKRQQKQKEGRESTSSESSEEEEEEKPVQKEQNKLILAHSSEDEDNDDDLFTIKRKDHEVDTEIGEDQHADISLAKNPAKAPKIVTKAALAKRVLKKKIVANKKVVFDEEGEQLKDPTKHLQSDLAREYENENEDDGGGIDIEKAKRLLREEDKFDKERFREKIKAKRKAKKQKLKKKRDDDQQELDDFGSDEDDDVDLSWLPDPDKIYGPKNSDEESASDAESEIHQLPTKLFEKPRNKRELSVSMSENSSADEDEEEDKRSKPIKKKAKKMASKLSVDEAEMLAMRLLGSE